jgi:folate-dependent phosphoribosylglycinamide formyltransferase PurN
VENSDTAETLAFRVHALEYEYFPKVIEEVISKLPERSKK